MNDSFPIVPNTSLQQTLDRLTTLAREVGAELQATVQLEESGATLAIHWWGRGSEEVPREANLYFGTNLVGDPDVFLFSFIIDPTLYIWAVDEGVEDEGAANHATRMLESVTAVEAYLLGNSYEFYVPKEKKPRRRAK